jgi:hypothetical protein
MSSKGREKADAAGTAGLKKNKTTKKPKRL